MELTKQKVSKMGGSVMNSSSIGGEGMKKEESRQRLLSHITNCTKKGMGEMRQDSPKGYETLPRDTVPGGLF